MVYNRKQTVACLGMSFQKYISRLCCQNCNALVGVFKEEFQKQRDRLYLCTKTLCFLDWAAYFSWFVIFLFMAGLDIHYVLMKVVLSGKGKM